MTSTKLIDRFKGEDGQKRLVEALRNQILIAGDKAIAATIAAKAELMEIPITEHLIRQGHGTNEIYFILKGTFRVFINGRDVATRAAGVPVGEMAVIDPGVSRSASVVASEAAVVARISDTLFIELAKHYPRMWRMLSTELAHRLDERRKFHRPPNAKVQLFIGSSAEH